MAESDWTANYKQLRSRWVKERGAVGVSKTTGAQLPRMIAGDAIAVIGPFTAAVLRFLENRQAQIDGRYLWHPLDDAAGFVLGNHSVTPQEYLMRGVAKEGEARARKLPGIFFGADAYVWPKFEGAGLEEAHKQMMASWQRAIDTSSRLLRIPPLTRPLKVDEVESVWSAMYAVVIGLDVAGETPTVSDWDAVAEIAKAAGENTKALVENAADVAGRAAAEIAETTGRAAGGLAHGFFSQAGLTAILVTAAAIYIALD